MAPFIVLIVSILAFWVVGRAAVAAFHDPGPVLRAALAIMFFFTSSAHWGKRRPDTRPFVRARLLIVDCTPFSREGRTIPA